MTVTIALDFEPYVRALADVGRAMDKMADSLRRMGRTLARLHEVQVCGLEARMYVRGGLDPVYAEEADLHSLVKWLLRAPHMVVGMEDALFLTMADRRRLAVAAMRGWAVHRG